MSRILTYPDQAPPELSRQPSPRGRPRSRRIGDEIEVVLDDPRGGAPDRVAVVVEEVDGTAHALALPLLDPEAAGPRDRRERHLDHALDLGAVRSPGDALVEHADQRRADEVGSEGLALVERAQRVDGGSRPPHRS